MLLIGCLVKGVLSNHSCFGYQLLDYPFDWLRSSLLVNSVSNKKILDLSKLKPIAVRKLNVDQ